MKRSFTKDNALDIRRFEIDDPQIDGVMGRYPHTVFQRPKWLAAVRDGLGYGVCYYGLADAGGRPELLLPGIDMPLPLVRLFYANIPSGSFVGEAGRVCEFIDKARRILRRDGFHVARIARGYYDMFGPIDAPGIRHVPASQHVLHIGGHTAESYYASLKKRVRYDVRRSQRRLAVRDVTSAGDIPAIDALYRQTIERNHTFRVWTPRIVELILERYIRSGEGEMLVAELEGRIVGCLITLYGGTVSHALIGVSDYEARSHGPSDLLFWTTIERAIGRGMREYDFISSPAGDARLESFKDKWHAECHDFCFYEMDLSAIRSRAWRKALAFSRTPLGSGLLRRFWKK